MKWKLLAALWGGIKGVFWFAVASVINYFVGSAVIKWFRKRKGDYSSPSFWVSAFVGATITFLLYIVGHAICLGFLFLVAAYYPSFTDNPATSSAPPAVTHAIVTPTPTRAPTPTPDPRQSATAEQLRVADMYQQQYPMTWGYILKYAPDPYAYVVYYDSIWGDMQRVKGDGIAFDTLTPALQRYVHYPEVGPYIYFAVGGSTWHSTRDCYTLLRSETSARLAKFASQFDPCSKCVGQ